MTINSVEEKILAAARYKLNLDEKVIQAGMFNQSSTSKQRKEFLEAILDSDNLNEGEENEAPDDDTLNQMISRSEEEYDFYQKMDESAPKSNRLITIEELPAWIKKSFEESNFISLDEGVETSITNISLNRVIGDDSRKRSYSAADHNSSDFSRNPIDSSLNSTVPSIFGSMKRKKRGRPALPERLALDSLLKSIQQTLDYIKAFETECDHRKISYVFYRLPTKKQLPYYYTIISHPIDIYSMERKISNSKYKEWQDFVNDFDLMISNALTYNPEGSQISNDAKEMALIFKKYCEQNDIDC
uniref:Transcription activator BRG1 (Trinotate prediction) n=1 Tax=Myxobolus squamalis TaxID=59785 RepID=A0A6B2G082_MYXSQ